MKRALDPQDIAIADDTGVVSLAAVMGGSTTEVSPSTVDVLFEAAHWDPISVARTIRRHKLPSEAGKRFERGVDPQITAASCMRAATLLVEYGGGTLEPRVTDVYAVAARRCRSPCPSTFRPARPAWRTRRSRVVDSSSRSAARSRSTGSRLTAVPPSWRPDLTDPADLVEEVMRLDGYDKVPSVLPIAPPGNGLTATQRRRRSIGRALADAGYVEALCYPFIGEAILDDLRVPADDERREMVKLVNPLSDEEPGLRTTLLPPLLGTLRRNLGRGARDVALFEIGLVFHPAESSRMRTAPTAGVDARPADDRPGRGRDVHPGAAVARRDCARRARRAVRLVGRRPHGRLGRRDRGRAHRGARGRRRADRAGRQPGALAPGPLCRAAVVGDEVVGYAGELHPAVCTDLELPKRTCAMELELDKLPLPGVTIAPRLSTFPTALIDVALVVERRDPGGRRSSRRSPPGPVRCWSRCGCSTCTPGRNWGRGASPWPTS